MTKETVAIVNDGRLRRPIPWVALSCIGIFVFAWIVLVAIYRRAWVSEDCFITFRYVENTLSGYGAVFNVGERVQGFTHPLWFLALLPGSFIFQDEILVAIVYGFVLSLMTLSGLAVALRRTAAGPIPAAIMFMLACLMFLSSDSWLSFQTGGLENSLSHGLLLWIIVECLDHNGRRPARLVLLLGFLCLTRPDFVLIALPLGLLVLRNITSWLSAGRTLLAGVPFVSWQIFAWIYYGHPIPNTATAKVGIFPDVLHATLVGLCYVADWCMYEPLAFAGSVCLLGYAIARPINPSTLALALGIVLHAAWVVGVGGDFMRGRFLMPMMTVGVALGILTLAGQHRRTHRWGRLSMWVTCACVLVASAVFQVLAPSHLSAAKSLGSVIVNERTFYPGYSLKAYLRSGTLTSPYLDLSLAQHLKSYAKTFGPVTIHLPTPGTIGYLSGPMISIIDLYGLTDGYIARLPKAFLVDRCPRAGHPSKYVPVHYLASRGDLSLLPNWAVRIHRKDGTLLEEVRSLEHSEACWPYGGDTNQLNKLVQQLPTQRVH